ncbi:hypothetical protein BISA_2240 [Bifidobacterium saguini DSM 23967]|uniref:Uncharacterized protein n=1 Tax=Bifidobacterium saguini DSM 23967 TaxID=1437607 RepID=A0A087D5R6_9BIFI|nr:hypothetical protein [Bifidobacterium saguini]KFI90866.1 hypothetical protein BISA_2240 [Bifidobacterium saguini DSM 23967]
MAQIDPEDGLDQIMVQSWNSVAQQLRALHAELRGDRMRLRERAERAAQNERYDQTRRQQQAARLEQWETENRERLNKGFESNLTATVLSDGDTWRGMRDSSLLQAWMVADQLEGNDPGFRRQIIEAKRRLKDEWSKRHPESHIDAASDHLVNHVTITYSDQSPALQSTLNAFNTAGVAVDLQRVDAETFRAEHGGEQSFWVDSRLTGGWAGYDHDRIVEAVMCAPVNGLDDAATRISFLQDQALPESSHSDNKAAGDEPSTVSEAERTENADAAPMPQSAAEQPDDADRTGEQREGNTSAHAAEPDRQGGGDLATGEPEGYEDMPLDLNESEEWYGPDPFGEYSPAMESSMNPAPQPSAETMPAIPSQTLAQPKTNGNGR